MQAQPAGAPGAAPLVPAMAAGAGRARRMTVALSVTNLSPTTGSGWGRAFSTGGRACMEAGISNGMDAVGGGRRAGHASAAQDVSPPWRGCVRPRV